MRYALFSLVVLSMSRGAAAAALPWATVAQWVKAGGLPALPPLKPRAGKARRPANKAPEVREPVRLKTAAERVTVKARKPMAGYLFRGSEPIELVVQGPTNLVLTLQQALKAHSAAPAVEVDLVVDDRSERVTLPGKPWKRGRIDGRPDLMLTVPKPVTLRLGGGAHLLRLVSTGEGHLVRVDHQAGRASEPAVVVLDLAPPAVAVAPPVSAPVAVVSPPAPAPPTPAPAPAKPAAGSPIEERIARGELRDGLLTSYPTLSLTHRETGERRLFQQVAAEQSYAVAVGGPGILTVRLHPLLKNGAAGSYALVILENDVVLQTLNGALSPDGAWTVEAAHGAKVGEPRELRLKIGAKPSRLVFQISRAAQAGMAIGYRFEAEKVSLADLSFDDEGPTSLPPTLLTEVDLREMVVEKVVYRDTSSGFLGVAVGAGAVMPAAGGAPAIAADVELRLTLGFISRLLAAGVVSGASQHVMSVRFADRDGAILDVRSTVLAVPMLGKLSFRLPLGESLALAASAGGGMVYVMAERSGLEVTTSATAWQWAAVAGAGLELALGPGVVAVEVGYTYVPVVPLAEVLENYSPGGPGAFLRYRFGK